MYHQNRDSRCPAEFATGHSGVDSPGTAGRYMYGPFYGPKGPDGSPYGNVNPPGGGLQTFGGKPSAVALQDTVYGTRWTAPGYVGGPGLKPGSDFVYSNQPSSGSYPDIGPMLNMTGYPPPSYGPGIPYSSQYPYTARGYSGSGGAYMDGYSDGQIGSTGQLPQPPSGSSWSDKSTSVNKGQDISSSRSPQWSYRSADGYSSSTPNTPSQPPTTSTDIDQSSHSIEQSALLSQQPAMSPQGHFDNELKKQPSVSSLRDALLSTPNSSTQQQYTPFSPQMPGGNPSPMTPTTNFPHTPDASTPAGGSSIMSPHMQQRFDDKHVSSESELINSFVHHDSETEGRSLRVSPFQVESILGIHDEPVGLDANPRETNSVGSQDRHAVLSPEGIVQDCAQPSHENSVHAVAENNLKTISDHLPDSPLSKVDSLHADDEAISQEVHSPSVSPVDHNHPCITTQYQFSDDDERKEFLDLLFDFLNIQGIGLVRIPTLSKAPLDLFKAYIAVQNLGGFINVTQKNLWPDVIKLLSPTSDNCSGSLRMLMRLYVRLLLPYECHVRQATVADCLSKVDSSVFRHMSFVKQLDSQREGLDVDAIIHRRKINGEAIPKSECNTRRLNSQTSESSTSCHEPDGVLVQESVGKDEHPNLDEGPQTPPVESYPQDVSSDVPLPEISAQETESLLAMPASPYLLPPVSTDAPSTPLTDPATPPSSYPPPYPPTGSHEWGPTSSHDMFPGSGHPSYSMDSSSYQHTPLPSQMPPVYSPYTPPQHDMSMDYHLDMSSPMIRSPYDAGPYHMGIAPAMHGLPSSRPNPFLYRPHMISRGDPFTMRSNDMYPGAPVMNADWAWPQGSHFPTMMHHQSPSRANPGFHHSPTSRVHILQQAPHPASQHRSPAIQSPGSTGDIKQQWQDHTKATKTFDATNAQIRSTKGEYNMAVASKSEQLDSLKRPLPDWSDCIEGTKPVLTKRKHLLSVDCGNVEPWRVMMSLKSGLLSESTWALDTLNILLHDDSTVGYFHLKHHHSLLNTLVDHLSKVLQAVFRNEFDSIPNHPNVGCSGTDTIIDAACTHQSLLVPNDNRVGDPAMGGESVCLSGTDNDEWRDIKEDHRLSHIELPTADECLLFTENEHVCQRTAHLMDRDAGNQTILKIDETPVSELLHREGLKNQLPLHYFGRSPRRREHSILEDIQIREELEKEIDERLHSEVDSEEKQKISNDQKRKEVFLSPGKGLKENCMVVFKEESEIYQKESLPLWSLPPNTEILHGRCLCLSNILRSLSFIPGNDIEFSQHPGVLTILGRILMLNHKHLIRLKQRKIPPTGECTSLESVHFSNTPASTSELSLPGVNSWWWDCLNVLRENTLVILSNISGQLDLSIFPESVSCPIITGLLHWVTCPSAMAVDPLPDTAMALALSPQRLVLEALAKISISEINVDFILATPPVTHLDILFLHLVQFIGQKKYPVMRQFALVLLSNLAQGNEAASRLLAQQKMVVPLLVECIESSEQTSCNSRGQLIGGYNPEDPNSLSVAMLRRAATTLHCLAKVPLNRTAFLPYRDRTLYLATSQYVEPTVSSILMDMIFELGKL